VVVVHIGGGGGGGAPASLGGAKPGSGRAVPPLVVPPPLDPLPAHEPVTLGLQEKPAPQSASMLQGSCHLNMQLLVVVVVHISSGGLGGAPASGQAWLAGQLGGATAEPPEQAVEVWAKQTMPAPQSASALHALAWQYITTVVVGEASGRWQSVSGLQPGWATLTVSEWHV
jgi:hypothetical protein